MSIGPDFRVVAKLGEGSFAEVFKVQSGRTGQFYAVKRLKKRYHSLDEVNRLPEVLALKAVRGHPNVIDLVDLIYDQAHGFVAMVFDLMECNLYEFTTAHKKCDEATALLLVYQLLKAISFLHSRGLFHRDVKPENCMVNKDTLVLKLVDFGSTRGQSDTTSPYTEYVSTRWYRAPECILTSGSYGPEVDEWAVGCMLYELLTAKPLFPGKHEIDQISKIHNLLGTPSKDLLQRFKQNPNHQISFTFPQRLGQDLHKFLPRISNGTVNLLVGLLTYNPQQRLSAAAALNLECFAPFREAEGLWERTDKTVPFPVFFFQSPATATATATAAATATATAAVPGGSAIRPPSVPKPARAPAPAPAPEAITAPDPPANVDGAVFVPPAPDVVVAVRRKPTFLLPAAAAPVVRLPPPPPPPPSLVQPLAMAGPPGGEAKPVVALMESRIRATQRIKAYQDAQKGSKPKKPLPFHGAAFQFASGKPAALPKPQAPIIQPKLTRLVL
jgi:serine/threonine protein kinase